MKISDAAIVSLSLSAAALSHSQYFCSAFSTASSVPSRALLPSSSSSSSSASLPSTRHRRRHRHRRSPTVLSVGKGARDLGLLTDTPLSDADQERINEKMAIEEVKDFLRSLNYRVAGGADRTKTGIPSYGDFAVDAARAADVAAAEKELEAEDEKEDVMMTDRPSSSRLPKLRATLGSSVFLSGFVRPTSSSSSSPSFDPLLRLLDLLNANSLVEDSPANFRFSTISVAVPSTEAASTKKKVVSREARYNGLLDKLHIVSEQEKGEEDETEKGQALYEGATSWIVRMTREEAEAGALDRLADRLCRSDDATHAAVLLEGIESEADGTALLQRVGWESVTARCREARKTCTLLAAGELYDGDSSHLYHVGRLRLDVADATGGSDVAASDSNNADTDAPSKLSRKEAYRILASALALESTANTALYLRERQRTLDAATAAVSVDPFEELFPFPQYTAGPDDDAAWVAYKKECYLVQERRKQARKEAEATLGKEKAAALEEERALKAVQGKLPRDGVLEDRLIVAMRELGFDRTMELDVLVDHGVLAYKKFVAKPTPLTDDDAEETDSSSSDQQSQLSPEELLILTKHKQRQQEAESLIRSIAYEWARRQYWEHEIQGDLLLYDPLAEKRYVADRHDDAMAFATDYYHKEYKRGKDQAEFEQFKEEKQREIEEREKAIFDKVKRKMLTEMDVDTFATIENLANIENEKKKAEYKYGQEVEYWWIGDPEDPERYQGVNVGPR